MINHYNLLEIFNRFKHKTFLSDYHRFIYKLLIDIKNLFEDAYIHVQLNAYDVGFYLRFIHIPYYRGFLLINYKQELGRFLLILPSLFLEMELRKIDNEYIKIWQQHEFESLNQWSKQTLTLEKIYSYNVDELSNKIKQCCNRFYLKHGKTLTYYIPPKMGTRYKIRFVINQNPYIYREFLITELQDIGVEVLIRQILFVDLIRVQESFILS